MFFLFLLLIVFSCLAWLLARFIRPRARMYVYLDVNGERRPQSVGYVTSDGRIIDTTLPRDKRRVGAVLLREGRGIVRVYRPELGADRYEDVGWVDAEGKIFSAQATDGDFFAGGVEVGGVSPNGTRHWYELWLRRHAEVPDADPEPYGKCVEAIRLGGPPPNAPTLLARAGAALLLYRRMARTPDEVPRPMPHSKRDVVLVAAALFAFLFLTSIPILIFDEYYMALPLIGREWSYIVSMLTLYFALWAALHYYKEWLASSSNRAREVLILLNRHTGIGGWNVAGIVLAIAGMWWGYYVNYLYFPLFAAIFIGFIMVRSSAPGDTWYIEPRAARPLPPPGRPESTPPDEPEADGQLIERSYHWELDTPLRSVECETTLTFRSKEVAALRHANPFHQNNKQAWSNAREVARRLVKEGETARQVQRLAAFIVHRSGAEQLTQFEEVQLALDFVQSPNIAYEVDEKCEEIGCPPEYFRLPAETLFDKRGDCDCKSVLAAALMRSLGYPVLLLVNDEAGHAAVAVGGLKDLGAVGEPFTVTHNGTRYYYCETTGDNWCVGQPSTTDMREGLADSIIDLSHDLLAAPR